MHAWLLYRAARAIHELVQDGAGTSAPRDDGFLFPDERARQRALAQLAQDSAVDARHVKLSVLSGELVITGRVRTVAMKERVADICRTVGGISRIRDELHVRADEDDSE